MTYIKIFLLLFIIVSCCSCSGKLFNQVTFWTFTPRLECYFSDFKIKKGKWYQTSDKTSYTGFYFLFAMDVLYNKYPETHITLEILKQLEQTDTIINQNITSLKEFQYSTQENYSKLASRDDDKWYFGWAPYIYRLKSPLTNNVFVFTNVGCLIYVFLAVDNFRPVYLKDLTFAEERALEKEFETELLPKIRECVNKTNYLIKHGIWKEDLE